MPIKFEVRLQGSDDSTATCVPVPAPVMRAFESRVRLPLRVTVNGVERSKASAGA